MMMPGREYQAQPSRFGFNGKENDNDVKGFGNQQDYGMRIYDTRIGKFLSVDPLTNSYPWYTPYQFAGNTPIKFVDVDGLEPGNPNQFGYSDGDSDPKFRNQGAIRQPSGKLDAVTRFGIGLLKVPFYVAAAISQIAGAAHYGNKVKEEKFAKQFPLLANNNIAKDLILPIFITPAELAIKLKNNPEDSELWGEATGILLLAKGDNFLGKFRSSEFGLKVDLMGGKVSKYGEGWINYDQQALAGIQDLVENFKSHFGENTVRQITVDNPQASFLEHVTPALQSDGTITVRGQMANSFFKEIYNGTAKGLSGYEVISKKTNLPKEGYRKSDGSPLGGGENSMNEIILRKKR